MTLFYPLILLDLCCTFCSISLYVVFPLIGLSGSMYFVVCSLSFKIHFALLHCLHFVFDLSDFQIRSVDCEAL